MRNLLEERGTVPSVEQEFCLGICASTIVTIVSDWLDSGMALPPAEIARYAELCVPSIVLDATELR